MGTSHRQRRRATADALLHYLRGEGIGLLVVLPDGVLLNRPVPARWHRVLHGLAHDLRRAQLREGHGDPWRDYAGYLEKLAGEGA